MSVAIKRLRLKSKEDRRFRSGHPWVYSNELQNIPKDLQPGDWVRLDDASGDFLAYGFGNPRSLISFREISREVSDDFSKKIEASLKDAVTFRNRLLGSDCSCRIVFGEADGIPGLVIDRFVGTESSRSKVVYVIQPHSAGAESLLGFLPNWLKGLDEQPDSIDRFFVLKKNVKNRELEGLTILPTECLNSEGVVITASDTSFLKEFCFSRPGLSSICVDLIDGQKTGFFFDQRMNVLAFREICARYFTKESDLRVIDFFSYVGQWGAELNTLQKKIHYTAVDRSEGALHFLKRNVGPHVQHLAMDLMRDSLTPLEKDHYDAVIVDPPALIKNRKSMKQGQKAYVEVYAASLDRLRKGGVIVFCSCSQLFSREDFLESIQSASKRAQKPLRILFEGGASWDHPHRPGFPEGDYLKCVIAIS